MSLPTEFLIFVSYCLATAKLVCRRILQNPLPSAALGKWLCLAGEAKLHEIFFYHHFYIRKSAIVFLPISRMQKRLFLLIPI